jgi:peptidoglycan/xylan/chitin deacetylase (PgdA/CDA1 family)
MGNRLVVLGWHNVGPSWFFPARRGAGLRGLHAQLAFLQRYAHVVPLVDGLQALSEGRSLPARAVAITFDDGYRDQLELAAPALERLRLPATFFLVPELLSGTIRPWWETIAWAVTRSRRDSVVWEGTTFWLRHPDERASAVRAIAARLKRRNGAARDSALDEVITLCEPDGAPGYSRMFLDWDGARGLARGNFTVGSHSLRHNILSNEGRQEQERDLRLSRQQLESELNILVQTIAYPNGWLGDYDATTIAAARAAGYLYGITTLPGRNRSRTPEYEIRRFVQQPERGVPGLSIVPLHRVRQRVNIGRWPRLPGRRSCRPPVSQPPPRTPV